MAEREAGEAAADDQTPPPAGTVVVLNNDLMFGSRIVNGLRAAGFAVVVEAAWERFEDAVRSGAPRPVLGIIDMNPARDWERIGTLARDASVPTPLLGFGPHVDVEGRRAAKAAGLDRIVSNGEFHRGMVDIVRRYALPPED